MKQFRNVILLLLSLLFALPSWAQQFNRTVVEGTGAVVQLDRPASSIFVGDPSVADVRVVSEESLFLAGISPGTTNVFALDFDDQLIATYRVRVVANNDEARGTLGTAIPNTQLRIENNEGAAIVRGTARTLDEAIAALDARRSLEGRGRTVIDRTEFKGGTQVSLKVRFVEASRTGLTRIGVDLSAVGNLNGNPFTLITGGGGAAGFQGAPFGNGGLVGGISALDGDFDALITALDQEGFVEILSEPTLSTISGRRANFRAGGEFAFPVNQGDGVITPEYRQFGVSLDFLPTVLPNKRIAIEVKPEVSFIDDSITNVSINGFEAPSLSVRSAETTVEVASGQTFAIAGLYEQRESDATRGIPGLSRSRVFGPLFGTRTTRRDERELLIFITPFLAKASDVSAPNRNQKPNVLNTVGFIAK